MVEKEPAAFGTGVPGVKEKKSTAERSAAPWSSRNRLGRSAVGGISASIAAISCSVSGAAA
jgi:hypothetical protein